MERDVDPFEAVRKLLFYSGIAPAMAIRKVEEALGMILLEDVTAPKDVPATDISLVDGYALDVTELAFRGDPPWEFELVEGVDPRRADEYTLRPGQAVLVDTGFPVPRGASAVVPLENAITEDGRVIITRMPKPWENILKKGSIARAGDTLIRAGRLLDRLKLRVLLELGVERVRVAAKPRVAIVDVGSEFVERRPYNRLVVEHFLSQLGVDASYAVVVPDDQEAITSLFRELRRSAAYDVVITIGGTGRGRMDVTRRALLSLEEPLYAFNGVKVSPGRTSFGFAYENLIVIGLGGPLPSTFSGALTLALPLVSQLMGIREVKLRCHGAFDIEGGSETYRIVGAPNMSPLRVLEVLSGENLFAIIPPFRGRLTVPAFEPVVDLDHGCEFPPTPAGTARF